MQNTEHFTVCARKNLPMTVNLDSFWTILTILKRYDHVYQKIKIKIFLYKINKLYFYTNNICSYIFNLLILKNFTQKL